MSLQKFLMDPILIARAVESFVFSPPARRSALSEFLTIVAAFLGGMGVIAVIFGYFLWLRRIYTLEWSLLYAGGAMAVSAAVLGGAAYLAARTDAIRRKVRNRKFAAKMNTLIESAAEEIGEPVRAYPKTAAALAALAGLAVGEKIEKEVRSRHARPLNGHNGRAHSSYRDIHD